MKNPEISSVFNFQGILGNIVQSFGEDYLYPDGNNLCTNGDNLPEALQEEIKLSKPNAGTLKSKTTFYGINTE